MGRKAKKQLSAEQKKIIAERLRKALKESKYKKQSDLADELGITRSSMSRMFVGDESDNSYTIPNMIALSNALGKRFDYLLGLSEYESKDLSLEDISKKTKLSEESVYRLVYQFTPKELSALNELISSLLEKDFFTSLHDYLFETDFDETVWHKDHIIDAEQIYISILSEDLKGIKKYSNTSLKYYEEEIDRLQKENEKLDKDNEKDAPFYWRNISDIDEYSKTIGELKLARRIENELKRPMSELELSNFEINGKKNFLKTESEEEEDENDGEE